MSRGTCLPRRIRCLYGVVYMRALDLCFGRSGGRTCSCLMAERRRGRGWGGGERETPKEERARQRRQTVGVALYDGYS